MQGRVRFFTTNKWGFIEYSLKDETKKIFFHISEIKPAEDGVQYEPISGCRVDFVISNKSDGRCEAKHIRIIKWPEP